MDEINHLFESVPLPYKYCNIPTPEEPDIVRKVKRCYSVNQVITNLTRTAFKHAGFSPTSNKSKWNASWGRQFDNSQYGNCQCWQKVNHFAGAYLIGRKDQLHKRMTELRKRSDEFSEIYPKSYLLPEDSVKLQRSWKKKVLWIVKPVASSRGRGIHVVSSKEAKPPQKTGIVQHYISRPLLITGRKFDIRLYALVTSLSPLRIYMHTSGLARFATHEYDPKAPTDRHMHLTNFSVNKKDESFIRSETTEENVENSKWSLSFLLKYLDESGIVDSKNVMKELEKVTTATIIAGMSEVRSYHNRYVIHRHTCYELYGIDVIMDENFHFYVMEINISPSLNASDSSLDFRLKYPLMLDLLRIGRIIDCNPKVDSPCPGVALIDKECRQSLAKGRTTEIETGKNNAPLSTPVFADFMMIRDFVEEKQRIGGFHRIYPKRKTMDEYAGCFGNMRYHDIVFGEWIKMDNQKRLKILQKHFSLYSNTMKSIEKQLGK